MVDNNSDFYNVENDADSILGCNIHEHSDETDSDYIYIFFDN